jgi:hypothetical protein
MPGQNGTELITDDELQYRRISEKSDYYHPQTDHPIDADAFMPRRYDVDGISLYRAKGSRMNNLNKFTATAKQDVHHEAHEEHEGKAIALYPSFVPFVGFVVGKVFKLFLRGA